MKNKSMYINLIASNFVVLLVAIIVAVVCFNGYSKFSISQSEDYNTVILRQIRSAFDEKMTGINKLLLNISSDPYVISQRFTDEGLTSRDRYHAVKVLDSLSSYVSVYNFIDSICLYYSLSDRVITSSSAYPSTQSFLSNADCAYWDEEEWKMLFDKDVLPKYYMHDGIFSVITPLYYDDCIYMVLNIDGSFINELTESIRSLEKSLIVVRDNETDEVLFSFGDELLNKYIDSVNTKTDKVILDRKVYAISHLPSVGNDWTYYFILPENAFIEEAKDVLTISLVILLLLCGTIICFVLAWRNFRPIKSAVTYITGKMDISIGAGWKQNELDIISEVSSKVIDEHNHLKDVFTNYLPMLRSKLLDQVFKGMIQADNLSEQDKLTSAINLPYDEFYVFIISLQDTQVQHASLTRLICPYIMEYISDIYCEESVAYCSEMSLDRIGVLANVSSYKNDHVLKLIRNITEHVYHKFGITATVAVGYCENGADQISKQYIQCLRIIEYQLIRCPGGIVFIDQQQEEKSVYLFYPAELEMRLIDSVKSGNIKNVNEIIDKVIIENFINSSLTLEISQCLFFNLMSTAIKVITTFGYSISEVFGQDINILQQITSCNNIQDMEAMLRGMFYSICVYINKNKDNCEQMIHNIVKYIVSNSADQNLSLNTLAFVFNMNPNYLSGYFKEQYGENFLVFLNRVRLDNAKKLLHDTDLGINDIALKTGYSGEAVLIRNFKKFFGITPGKYRENISKTKE